MKRKILWILLPILAVGAIALAIVLTRGSGAAEKQPELPVEAPAALKEDTTAVSKVTPSPEPEKTEAAAKTEATTKPEETEAPEASTKPVEEEEGEAASPTPVPTDSGEITPVSTPSPTPDPVVPAGDEDELPLLP